MMRRMKVEDIGDTEFLPEEIVDKFKFRTENNKVLEAGGRPAQGKAMLLGITKASLSTDSEHLRGQLPGDRACTHRSRDQRQGGLPPVALKENVIMGSPGSCRYRHGGLLPGENRGRGCGGRDADRGASGRHPRIRRGDVRGRCTRAVFPKTPAKNPWPSSRATIRTAGEPVWLSGGFSILRGRMP